MLKVYFDGVLLDEDYYQSLTNDWELFDSSFFLGSCVANHFTFKIPYSCIIDVPSKVEIYLDEKLYSTLIVDKYEISNDNILSLDLVDNMVLLDFDYDASSIVPCTTLDILKNICVKAGITLGTEEFVNDDVAVDYYDNTITAREYVSYIAELNGGYACIGEDGKLYLKQFNSTPVDLDVDECEDYVIGEKHVIERVVFDNGLLKFETSSNEDLETLYLNESNVYITSETIFDNIASVILKFEFYNFQSSNCPIKDVKAGDLLNIISGDNNYITIAQYDLEFNGSWIGGYSLDVQSVQQEETKITGLSTSVKSLKVSLDRTNNELDIIASEIDDTTEQISSIELNIDNITQTVSTLSDQSSAIASITVTLEEIQQEITALSDLTTSDIGMGSITLKDVNESALIYLQIYPTATDISYLYPSNSLYPSTNLYPLSRDVVIKSDEEEIRYTLPCNLLYYSSDVYDEFIYSYETSTCYKIKRVDVDENGNKYPLDEEEVIYYDFELINLSGGDYSIYLLSFSDGMLQARAMVSNLYTDQYVTQAQYTSGLSVLKEEITASVEEELTLIDGNIETLSSELNLQSDEISLKLNSSDFTSSAVINLINNRDGTSTALISADNINLTASNVISLLAGNTLNLTSNNIAISSTNFSVTSAGVITATGADISGKITATSGSFTGSVYASSGTIGGMTLTSNSIYSGTSSMSSTTAGIYLGTAGFRQYSSASAYVNIANGILTCAGATITGTISGSTISGSTISGGSITIGDYFSVTSTGLTQMSTSGKGFLSLQTTTHPYASALSLVNGENYGIYFVSGTSQSSVGSNLSHIYDSGSGSLFIRSLTSSGTVNINHTGDGAVGGAVGISNIVIDSNTITGSGGASMFANNNCAFVPASGYYAYVGATSSSSNRIAVSSSGPSSLNVKKNLVNIEDEYEDLYKDLQKINMYNFDYKYKGIKDFDSDFGFIIDELEDTEHISKYIRNFECRGRIENDTLIKKENDDVKDEDLPFSYKEWERDAYIKLLFILTKSIQNKIDKLESEVANG